MGTLFVVSTPIGNLKDISIRALDILFQVEILLCEDTRKTGLLINSYRKEIAKNLGFDGKPKLVSFFEGNEEMRIAQVIAWLESGKQVALVSNSGTPLVSDPGFKLVRECRRRQIKVTPIPGATAITAGLVISGMPTDKFMFIGFLPKKKGKKERLLKKVKEIFTVLPLTIVFYESPQRLITSLSLIEELAPKSTIVLARELTKKFEEQIQGSPKKVLQQLEEKNLKGECVICWRPDLS